MSEERRAAPWQGRAIEPLRLPDQPDVAGLVDSLGNTCFQARNLGRAARLYQQMIEDGDTIWLAIAGAGIAGGLGGPVIDLLERGFVDVICSTGAQVYHDLHFAYDLPVHQLGAGANDEALRAQGDTRIYDIVIREQETLVAQDEIIRRFVTDTLQGNGCAGLSSPEFNHRLGGYVDEQAPLPDRSFVVHAARQGVPIFWDSTANHSIAMTVARAALEGERVQLLESEDILLSAAVSYDARQTSFIILGGGGPKNFIQQTGPTLEQILGLSYPGAERGVQVTTAVEQDGGLSGCTFDEAVTWGKYRGCEDEKLVRVWAEYSLVLPLLAAYVTTRCQPREPKRLFDKLPALRKALAASATAKRVAASSE